MSGTQENRERIIKIEKDIETIKNNHLAHIESDVASLRKIVEKVDNRIWWIGGLIIAGAVGNMFF
jgi:polyhydroxyalkanoate synthesis regulator phasin